MMHERVRCEIWAYAPSESHSNDNLIAEAYQGIRPAPGYPACPDHTEKRTLFELLDAEEALGVTLTESFAMAPAASVSAGISPIRKPITSGSDAWGVIRLRITRPGRAGPSKKLRNGSPPTSGTIRSVTHEGAHPRRARPRFDGAMGTLLYNRGVFVNICYDELNVGRPDIVREIHEEYVAAGAEVLETNTFGANPVKLSSYGLAERTEEINEAAGHLAKQAAGSFAKVAGAIGPLGIRIEPWGPTAREESRRFLQAAGRWSCLGWSGWLRPRDVLRPHGDRVRGRCRARAVGSADRGTNDGRERRENRIWERPCTNRSGNSPSTART